MDRPQSGSQSGARAVTGFFVVSIQCGGALCFKLSSCLYSQSSRVARIRLEEWTDSLMFVLLNICSFAINSREQAEKQNSGQLGRKVL